LAAIHFQRLSTGVLGCIHDTTPASSARPLAKAYVECSEANAGHSDATVPFDTARRIAIGHCAL
jgi:hypothetical protein